MNHLKRSLSKSMLLSSMLLMAPIVQAAGLLVKIQPYGHQLPQSVSDVCYKHDNCPEIKISYVNSNRAWINERMNQKINELIAGESKYSPVRFNDYQVEVPEAVKESLNAFANRQMQEMPKDSTLSYSKSVEPYYMGHLGSLDVFEINGYDYWGGAHGIGFVLYPIFDSDLKQEIDLDDMLIAGQKPVLSKLVENEFDKWIIEQGEKPSDHKEYWKFSLTNNVTFTNKGLTFVHQPYEIAPYAAGMPELTVAYDKLEGVIKSKYLQAGKQLID